MISTRSADRIKGLNITIARKRLRKFLAWFPWLAILGFLCVGTIAPSILAPYPPTELHPSDALQPPSARYLLGTDEFGRDLLSRALYGIRSATLVGGAGVGIAMVFGITLGLIAGYYHGLADALAVILVDVLLSFPLILFAILMTAALGASVKIVVLSVSILYMPIFVRLVRSSVLTLKDTEFVLASRAVGASDSRILFRVILPNALTPLIIQATLSMALAVSVEASLSYLGLGAQPPSSSWGTMLRTAQNYLGLASWYVLVPGAFIVFTIMSLNIFGDWLRERTDPRLRSRR